MTTIERTDIDFEAWLSKEIEIECEISDVNGQGECYDQAEWVMSYTPLCKCAPRSSTFICDGCHTLLNTNCDALCSFCRSYLTVHWIERL